MWILKMHKVIPPGWMHLNSDSYYWAKLFKQPINVTTPPVSSSLMRQSHRHIFHQFLIQFPILHLINETTSPYCSSYFSWFFHWISHYISEPNFLNKQSLYFSSLSWKWCKSSLNCSHLLWSLRIYLGEKIPQQYWNSQTPLMKDPCHIWSLLTSKIWADKNFCLAIEKWNFLSKCESSEEERSFSWNSSEIFPL